MISILHIVFSLMIAGGFNPASLPFLQQRMEQQAHQPSLTIPDETETKGSTNPNYTNAVLI